MDRYPGIVPFSPDQEDLFFGRDVEQLEMLRRVVLYKLVVLFGKSGTGKSSLLRAGVLPELDRYGMYPVFIRLNHKDSSGELFPPEQQVYQELVRQKLLAEGSPKGLPMYEYFRGVRKNLAQLPLLIFDQFEELFTLHANREEFVAQLTDLVMGPVVRATADLEDYSERLDEMTTETRLMGPDVHFVFSIRSDYLYLLDQLSKSIPTIFLCRYELSLLAMDKAVEAITMPAQLEGDEFQSPPFKFSENALQLIGQVLSKQAADSYKEISDQEIEPFQLQLLCTAIEKKVIQDRKPFGFSVTPEFFGGEKGIHRILQDFFDDSLKKVPKSKKALVVELLGKGLLKNQRRVMLDENTIASDYQISDQVLEQMTAARLLRKETRQGIAYYEISHDTLVDPAYTEFKKLRAKRRRKNFLIGLIVALALLTAAVLAIIWIFHQKEVAQSAKFSLNSFIVKNEGQVALANLLAVEAVTKDVNLLSEKALHQALNASPHLQQIFYAHGDVASLSVTPNGRYLLAGTYDGVAELWDTRARKKLRELNLPDESIIYSIAISRDGRLGVAGDDKGRLTLWDLQSGKLIFSKKAHGDIIWAVTFDAEGKRIFSGANDKLLSMSDTETGKQIGNLASGANGIVWCLNLSTDGKYLAAGFDDRSVSVWDVKSDSLLRRLSGGDKGHQGYVSAVCFSVDGNQIVSGSDDKSLIIWDVRTGEISRKIAAHSESVWGVSFSANGRRVISASNDKFIRLWDVATGRQIGEDFKGHQGAVLCMTSDSSRQVVFTGAKDASIRQWDIQIQGQIGEPFDGHTGALHTVRFNPRGTGMASSSDDHSIILWNHKAQVINRLSGHSEKVWGLAYSPNGKLIASGSFDLRVKLWDAQTGKSIGNPVKVDDWIREIAFSPDGKYLAAACSDNVIFLWELIGASSLDLRAKLKGHKSSVVCLAFSPDSKKLVSGSYDRTIRLWDVGTGDRIGKPWQGHDNYVWSVAFSPDGKLVASGSEDGSIRFWDPQNGHPNGEPIWGTASKVFSIAFSPNSRLLVSGSEDRTVRVWDVPTRMQIGQPFWGHSGPVRSVAFSPNGHTMVSGSDDSTARYWQVPVRPANLSTPTIKTLKQQALKLANRRMTPDEWRQYIGEDLRYNPQHN